MHTTKTLVLVAICAWFAGAYMQELYIADRQRRAHRRRTLLTDTWCAQCFNYKRENMLAPGEACGECGRVQS